MRQAPRGRSAALPRAAWGALPSCLQANVVVGPRPNEDHGITLQSVDQDPIIVRYMAVTKSLEPALERMVMVARGELPCVGQDVHHSSKFSEVSAAAAPQPSDVALECFGGSNGPVHLFVE